MNITNFWSWPEAEILEDRQTQAKGADGTADSLRQDLQQETCR